MSQQQLVPEPQDGKERTASTGEDIQQPYRSTKFKSGDGLKDEHPSTFEASIPPYGYRAQDTTTYAQNPAATAYNAHHHETDTRSRQYRRRRFSPDGDALENGYLPYRQRTQQYQVPVWARPQQRNGPHVLRWLILIIVAIVFIKPLIAIIGALFLAGLSVLAFIILIPLIVIGALLIAGVVLAILGIALGRAVWRSGWKR